VSILREASQGLSLREYGRILYDRMDSVNSPEAGFSLVKALRTKTLWTPSSVDKTSSDWVIERVT
jgi:hypothetical protein